MSDGRVRAAIERMEVWLDDPAWMPNADELAPWEDEFQAAQLCAERAEGWMELVARAHAAARRLEERLLVVAAERDRLRIEVEAQERGNRALRGYGAGTR